jgi:hypothetical protein
MLRHDDPERRKISNRDAILEWRRALEREWDADKRRRESRQSGAAVTPEPGSDAGAASPPRAKP